MDTVSWTNQPPKQVDNPDDVVEPMDTVSWTNQPPKQIDGAGDDKMTLAFDTLTATAAELGYSIHGVPCDGNCLFSAIAYQLESIGIQSVDAQTLRKMAVNYLRSNPFVDGCITASLYLRL